jgi:hypothetical protein
MDKKKVERVFRAIVEDGYMKQSELDSLSDEENDLLIQMLEQENEVIVEKMSPEERFIYVIPYPSLLSWN